MDFLVIYEKNKNYEGLKLMFLRIMFRRNQSYLQASLLRGTIASAG